MSMPVAKTATRKDADTGEYVVAAYDANNHRMPNADYFTDDREDARETALAMTATFRMR